MDQLEVALLGLEEEVVALGVANVLNYLGLFEGGHAFRV